jgi:polyribonucleotide nucleotidyltransferase
MFKIVKKELDWHGLNLTLETGLMARQADGAVLAKLGGTSVLCTVSAARSVDPKKIFSHYLFTT